MPMLLQDKMQQIAALCRKYNVASLFVFGSILRNDFNPASSDVDFLVRFQPLTPSEKTEAYFGLLESLEVLFGEGRVDLVMEAAVKNPYIFEAIEQSKEVLYAA